MVLLEDDGVVELELEVDDVDEEVENGLNVLDAVDVVDVVEVFPNRVELLILEVDEYW